MTITTDLDRRANGSAVPSDGRRGPRFVSGPLDPTSTDELCAHLEQGGSVVIAPEPGDEHAERLTGVVVEADLPRTEWFVTLADRPERGRLDLETPITSPLRTLTPRDASVEVAATTSVQFDHRPTITVRRHGRGCVVASGASDLDAVARHPAIARFVDRLARADLPAPTRDLGVGVVGYGPYGGMGHLHGLAATETDGLRLVAAADSVPSRLDAARADFTDLHVHDSATALAGDGDVDIAIVATPPVHHAAIALELLRAGKHVVVEKPMCLHVRDAEKMMAVAAEHDRTLTVHQSRRWDRDWLAVQHVVADRRIGDVFNVETFVGGFEHPCRAWHSEESVSGGAVYDWGSHHVDWILQLFGSRPARVLCTTHTRVWHDTTNVDQLSLWMQWDDGREATFRQSDVCAIRRPKFHLEGTEGSLEGHYAPMRTETVEPGRGYVDHLSHHAEAPVDLSVVRYEGGYGLIETTVPPAPHPGWGFHRNLADHLLFGEPLAVPPEQSRDVVAVLEAGQRSGAAGGSVVEPE